MSCFSVTKVPKVPTAAEMLGFFVGTGRFLVPKDDHSSRVCKRRDHPIGEVFERVAHVSASPAALAAVSFC